MQELIEVVGAYDASEPWWLETEGDLPSGHVRFRLKNPPPQEISLILGDVVHNLRSALDYATCSLVELDDKDADLGRTQFPFGKIGEPLSNREKNGAALGDLQGPALRMIEEARRCCGDALHMLNLLSNQDKHRLLLAAAARSYPVKFQIDPATNTANIVSDMDAIDIWHEPLDDGMIIPARHLFKFDIGILVEGKDAPIVIDSINQINEAVLLALLTMSAAHEMAKEA